MPCRYDPTPEELNASKKQQRAKLDELTRMLCEATQLLQDNDLLPSHSELGRWKDKHDEADRAREAEEERQLLIERASSQLADIIDTKLRELDPDVRAAVWRKLK